MSFPRQGCSIVYDGEKREYNFHKGVAQDPKWRSLRHKDELAKSDNKKDTETYFKINGWMLASIILASALGVSLAINIVDAIW